jgi:phytoene synthase
MPTVEESYAHCRNVARSQARNFFYSFVLLPRARRDAMCAIYAFMRRSDDIVDNEAVPIGDRRKQIDRWRRRLSEALRGDTKGDAVLTAFHDVVDRYAIPHGYFFELLDGMESDLSAREYETFDDLYPYCYRAASVVGMATVHVFGFGSDTALALAAACGVAFQLTNIMRDVSADAAMGRVYFPSAELEEFGLSRTELLDDSIRSTDERFQRFMEFQWRRAERFYRESADLLTMVDSASRPALWAMVSIYHGLLRRIRKARYNVFGQRVRLPVWRKLWIVGRAMHLRATGGIPPFPA